MPSGSVMSAIAVPQDMQEVPRQWHPDFRRLSYAKALAVGVAAVRRGDEGDALLVCERCDVEVLNWAQAQGPVLPEVHVSAAVFERWVRSFEAAVVSDAMAAAHPSGEGATTQTLRAEDLSAERLEATDSPVVKLVNATVFDALSAGASDVHLETQAHGLAIKFRLDGVLRPMRQVHDADIAQQVISRIKVMADLDIAERRVPQDGRLQVQAAGRLIDVRVSIMPSIHGEDAVMRILDRQHLTRQMQALSLEALGFHEGVVARVLGLAQRPHGMVLVTGPTGSGKTTTLYATIQQSCRPDEKVVTIEDPVEYQLAGVLQIPVNDRKGLTFARGLRSILRHDPDKILVGEIRDPETAQIAVQAALTGHLVFTTVHANDVLDVLGRFQQFGIDPYALASALNGVLAQRLVRKLCSHCAEPDHTPWSTAMLDALRVSALSLTTPQSTRRAVGCSRCHNSGYQGRFAVGEVLCVNPELKTLLIDRGSFAQIQAAAERQGLHGLQAQGLQAAWAGHTTLEEVTRVVGSI